MGPSARPESSTPRCRPNESLIGYSPCMNPDRLWRELANDALADQINAATYGLFVAMPFRDQFSYHSDLVMVDVIGKAVEIADASSPPRQFANAIRADRMSPNAKEITDVIVEGILFNHFFLADVTMANHGVLVELGVALALESINQIIVLVQGNVDDLHFDIQDNRYISYDRPDAVNEIARALLDGASSFEASFGNKMAAIRRTLSPQAVYLLNFYGRLRKQQPGLSLHAGVSQDDENLSSVPVLREVVFNSAAQELLGRGLLELDYAVADDGVNPDRFDDDRRQAEQSGVAEPRRRTATSCRRCRR
jgi:hypothetical protein